MIVLGISEGPGASAALVRDGELVAVVGQERIDRVPGSSAFPSGAIDAVLDRAGIRAREVDRVCVGGAPPPLDGRGAHGPGDAPEPSTSLTARALDWMARASTRPRLRGPVTAALRASGLHTVNAELVRRRVEPLLRVAGFERAWVSVIEEDRCQAHAAYRTQGEDPLLVVVLDESTDGAAVSVSVARNGQLDRLVLQTSFAPLCGIPARLAVHLGIRRGEVDALSRAPARPEVVAAITREIGFDGGLLRTRAPRRGLDPLEALLANHPGPVFAASALVAIETAVVAFVRHWMDHTGVGALALSGTIFRHPTLVGRVLTECAPRSLYVPPGPGATAVAIGAAVGNAGTAPTPLATLALGPGATDAELARALAVADLPRRRADDVAAVIAEALAAGKLVARYADGLPAGPRALGLRSLLFRADDPAVAARAAEALGRAAVTACAVVREERAASLLPALGSAGVGVARHAQVAIPAPALVAALPALAGGDGTVRPLVVGPGDPLHAAGLALEASTGAAAFAEVGLEPEHAPLPASPGDMIRAFRASGADVLILGDYVVTRQELPA